MPALDQAGVKLIFVAIGDEDKAVEFCRATGFPPERLFCDPEARCYQALRFRKGNDTGFNLKSIPAFRARQDRDNGRDLKDVMRKMWEAKAIWRPPRLEFVLAQGGMQVLQGRTTLFSHYDPAVGVHADMDVVTRVARDAAKPWWDPRAPE